MKTSILCLLTVVTFTLPKAQAYFNTMDTGQITEVGKGEVTAVAPVIFQEPNDGFNLNGRFSTGINDDSEIQAELGVGSVDLYAGGFFKYVPFPDTYEQPALGGRAGVVYAEFNDLSTYGFNISPMASKNFDGAYGRFTPYISLPIGILTNRRETFMSLQGTLGMEWSRWVNMRFMVEYSFNMKDALDYLSVGASFDI